MANNITAIYGEVPELVEKKSNELTHSFLNEDKDDFNYIKYNLYETDMSTVIEEALTMPFISEKKVIVVKNAFMFTGEKVNKDITPNNEQVIEFLEKYDGENLVIFEIYSNKLDERKKLTKTLKKTSKLSKVEQMSEQEIKSWIQNQLHENYKDIKQDALNLFIELTGVNFNIVSQELDKISLFLGDRTTITKNDVSLIINRSLEQNVFLLTEFIQKNQKDKAIQLVKDLIIMKEEPIKLLALITSNY
ncbi:DNA polymerase III subunit delta, partial [Staphylococcus haemolyticus]